MIDPPDRNALHHHLAGEMARYDAAHGMATTRWRRFRRWRYQRMLRRRLYDRHSTRHS